MLNETLPFGGFGESDEIMWRYGAVRSHTGVMIVDSSPLTFPGIHRTRVRFD